MNNSIYNLIVAPWASQVVFTANRLKVFTRLGDQLLTVEEIAFRCGAIVPLLKPLFEACVCLRLLEQHHHQYQNSHFSRVYLVEGAPLYVGDLIELQFIEFKTWNELHEIMVGHAGEAEVPDKTAADYRTYIKGMHNLGMLGEAAALKNAVDLSACKQMIDAGGGSGIYSTTLCQQYPHLQAKILDQAETLAVTAEMLASCAVRERITLCEADITQDSFGENIDVVLLSDVIYDLATATPVLKNAWNCLRQNGLLLIRGYYSDPDHLKSLFGALFTLNSLVFDPNREILTMRSLEKVVSDAGFKITRRAPLTELSWLLMAQK